MGAHGMEPESSLYNWGTQDLKSAGHNLREFANRARELARQAQDCQPVPSALAARIAAAANLVGAVSDRAESWPGLFRTLHEEDVTAVENPRKSPQVEARSDVSQALRDT